MSEELEAARRELGEALAAARASLAQVRSRHGPILGADSGVTDHLEGARDDA